MDTKNSSRANLKKYIKLGSSGGSSLSSSRTGCRSPAPSSSMGSPVRSQSGTFYLEYYEDGRRVQKPVGRSPREAKDAWYTRLASTSEKLAEPDEGQPACV